MPGFTFPTVGRLGFTSPPSASHILGHRYYVQLRLPRFHLGSLRLSLAPRYLVHSPIRSFAYSTLSGWRLPACAWPFSIPVAMFPVLFNEELAVLSSSQTTLICTCPARRLRWCLKCLPYHTWDSCLPVSKYCRL